MTALMLRTIAIISMLFDHIGWRENIYAFRIIGRLALPVFAFLIANGYRYTSNLKRYALRLFIAAVVSEIPYDLLFNGKITLYEVGRHLIFPVLDNIFFTLLIGLLFLLLRGWYYKKAKPAAAFFLSFVTLGVLCFTAIFISAEYGASGVLLVALFGLVDKDSFKNRIALSVGLLFLSGWSVIFKALPIGFAALGFDIFSVPYSGMLFIKGEITAWDLCQLLRVSALPLIFAYNGKSGMPDSRILKNAVKYGFYAFYPIHIIILYLISVYCRG